MKKWMAVTLALAFLCAFVVGAGMTADAGNCTFKCSCTGTPLKCCPAPGGGETCFPAKGFACPQIITC